MKNKKRRKLIISLIIINLIILLMLSIYSKISEKKDSTEKTDEQEKRPSEYVRPDTVIPMRMSKFSEKYNGNISNTLIEETVTNYSYYISDNKDYLLNIDNKKINDEFEKNKDELKKAGIVDIESFKNVISNVKKLSEESLELSYIDIDPETISINNNETSADIYIKYENCDEIVSKLNVINSYKTDVQPVYIK